MTITERILVDGTWRTVVQGAAPSLVVETRPATDVSDWIATFEGELLELAHTDASVYFEWGEVDGGLPHETDAQTHFGTGGFSATVDGLEPETTYEYRAVAEGVDVGIDAAGDVETFTTDEEPAIAPVPDDVQYRWAMAEGAGDVTVDSVSGVEMELDSPEWQHDVGDGGRHLSFDGTADRGRAPYQSDFDGLEAITVNFWINTTDVDHDGRSNIVAVNAPSGTTSAGDLAWNVAKGADDSQGYLEFRMTDGDEHYGDANHSGQEGVPPDEYGDGDWHMATCVWEGSSQTHRIYVDGEELAEMDETASEMDTVGFDLTVGATQDGSRPTESRIDGVEIAPDVAWDGDDVQDRYEQLQEFY